MHTFPKNLLHGYQNFTKNRYLNDRKRYQELAQTGQKPHTMIIACCDSRSAPETIFDCGPGEIFVVRNVANLVPPYSPNNEYNSMFAALEFAVISLKIQQIVVMGHACCGGIAAALSPDSKPLSPDHFTGHWINIIKPAAKSVQNSKNINVSEQQTALERISVSNSVENLRTFPFIKTLEKTGSLGLFGAWFDIAKGELWIMDHTTGDFIPHSNP